MEEVVIRLLVDHWGKLMALTSTLSGPAVYLGMSLWKLSRAVTRFEMTQERMAADISKHASAIEKVQLDVAHISGVLKVRHNDVPAVEVV